MSVSPATASEFLRCRAEKRRQACAALEEKARRDAACIVSHLVKTWHPDWIWQWGSLTRIGEFREWSDIDIAIEGLADPLAGLKAAEEAASMTSFPVDLVELDRIDPRHARTIRDEGVLVYESKNSRDSS
jgi:predicted nucleotidyltransferase